MSKSSIIITVLLFALNQVYSANDKYRLILRDDPATTMTIGWNQISGTDPVVYYDTIDHGTNYSLYAFQKSVDRSVYYRGMQNKFARLTGLEPDKAYYFVIHDSEGTSERYWFKTSPDDMSRLSIIAGGDSRSNRPPRQRANLLVSKLKPNAVLFGGDFTKDDTDYQWKNWMDDWQYTIAGDGRMFPIVPTMGNHESYQVVYNLFDTPTETYYYATTFGDNLFRVYTLNTEVSVSGNQLDWLKEDLATHTDAIWKGAQYHRPMRPHTADKDENDAAYDAWANLFFENQVRVIVECDAHVVKYTWPIQPSQWQGNDEGFIVNDTHGCVFIGEGGWGAPLYDNDDDKSWTRNSGKFYQFKLLFIDESKIEIRTVKTDNANDVGEVSNEDPFTLPENLDVWNPSNGAVVEILPAPPVNEPEIQFTASNPSVFLNGENISLTVEALNTGNGIENVAFYINGELTETITTPPYTFTHTYPDGQYYIEAVATDSEGLFGTDDLNVSIGIFTENDQVKIKNGQDDVEETEAGAVYFSSSDLEMVFDDYAFIPGVPNGFQKIGLRFQNVNIPHGAVIEEAYIQFRSDETDSEPAEFLIFAEDSGDAAPFDDGDVYSVSARPTFDESVYWEPPAWTSTGQTGPAQKTPDVGNLLQQIIDRDDWLPGNDIVFKVVGTGVSLTNEDAIRVADSYEGKPTLPATLKFTYNYDATVTKIEEERAGWENYTIYPNPFGDHINFSTTESGNKSVNILITDVFGKIVFSETAKTNNGTFTINPNIKQGGVYLVKIISESGATLTTKKMVKL